MTWALLEAGLPCAQDEAAWRAGDRPAAGGGLRQHYATSATQQVTAWNPKPSPFLPKKRSLELRTLMACRSLDRSRAERPGRAGPPGRTGSPSQPGYF